MRKKILAVVLAIIMTTQILAVSAFAERGDVEYESLGPVILSQEEKTANQSAANKIRASLQKKYDIVITYPDYAANNGLATICMEYLQVALKDMTANMIKQISAYYKNLNGIPLTFSYSALTYQQNVSGTAGRFSSESSTVHLYIDPENTACLFVGYYPATITHEVGHAFHQMCGNKLGSEKIQSEWVAFNGSSGYAIPRSTANPNNMVFASSYGSAKYGEDFAEVFRGIFSEYGEEEVFYKTINENPSCALRKKAEYISGLIQKVLQEPDTTMANVSRVLGS